MLDGNSRQGGVQVSESISPFEFVNNINAGEVGLMFGAKAFDDTEDPSPVLKAYSSFLVGRHFSHFPDTVLYANEVNTIPGICPKMHFDFLRNAMRPRKRYSKWAKKDNTSDEKITAVMTYYGYSRDKAVDALSVLNDAQVNDIMVTVNRGGCE